MKDIASHITDIVENALRAGASKVRITLSFTDGVFFFSVSDDGRGVSAEAVRRAADPFFTTRTERKIGLGLPLLFQSAEQCGGRVSIRPAGGGTAVDAVFPTGNVDCPPTGNLGETLMQVITCNPSVNTTIILSCGIRSFCLSSEDVIEAAKGLDIGLPRVAAIVREMLAADISDVFGRNIDF